MMAGILLFAGVSWFMHRAPDWQQPPPGLVDSLSTFGRVLWGAAGAGLVVLFLVRRNAESPIRASNLAIVAWSMGEALAIFGVVFFYLTAVPVWFIAGILAMSITFVAYPPPTLR